MCLYVHCVVCMWQMIIHPSAVVHKHAHSVATGRHSLMNLEVHYLAGLAASPASRTCQSQGCHAQHFYVDTENSDSAPHTCIASSFTH